MALSNKPITKAHIRLRGCTGWSAPLLFANTEDSFSRVEAHIFSFENSIDLQKPADQDLHCFPFQDSNKP